MAVRVSDRPTISCVYAAFDDAAQKVFRRAMECSTGSIVRVADLLVALSELAIDAATGLVSPGWQPPRRTTANEPWLTPMSNEPALRTLLETAYLLVRASGRPLTITPRGLWQAAANAGHLPSLTHRPLVAASSQRSCLDSQPMLSRPSIDNRSMIARVLTGWLNVHAELNPLLRVEKLQQLLPLVRQVEECTVC